MNRLLTGTAFGGDKRLGYFYERGDEKLEASIIDGKPVIQVKKREQKQKYHCRKIGSG
jgi:hypothetical protein